MAHLYIILSGESPVAMLIKRGPGHSSCAIGWDRTNDTFQRTQCIKGKLECPDLSPDGQYFSFFVNTQKYGDPRGVYRAVSRAPWLKAFAFWSSSSWTTGPGPGLFYKGQDGALRLWGGTFEAEWDHIGLEVTAERPVGWQHFVEKSFQLTQLQRDGWIPITAWEQCPAEESLGIAAWQSADDVHRITFQKSLRCHGLKLQLTHWCGISTDENRGISFETFAICSPDGITKPCDGWESADYDTPRSRVVWTRNNILYTANLEITGLVDPKVLFDVSQLKFEAREAPY